VPDRGNDAATGMTTPAVRYGPTRALVAAGVAVSAGLCLLGWALSTRYGPGWALLGVAVSAAFPVDALASLRSTAAGGPPSSAAMRRRGAALVMVADVLLVSIPLLAG
jgi:4-hydroxybenzoate polyprenyltransferase